LGDFGAGQSAVIVGNRPSRYRKDYQVNPAIKRGEV
jgi:hypothetical protein